MIYLTPSNTGHDKKLQISGVTFLYTPNCNYELQMSSIILCIFGHYKRPILKDSLNTKNKGWGSK